MAAPTIAERDAAALEALRVGWKHFDSAVVNARQAGLVTEGLALAMRAHERGAQGEG